MIFIEIFNSAVKDLLLNRFESAKLNGKFEKVDYSVADFDGVMFRIFNVKSDKSCLYLGISFKCFNELLEYDVMDVLKSTYNKYLCTEKIDGCDCVLKFNAQDIADANIEELAHEASLLKLNCFSSVFRKFFDYQQSEKAEYFGKQAVIHFRHDETMYVQAKEDRVTVIFSTVFKDPDDIIIGKVFMQEFSEVRRRIDRAPQVLYSHRVPPKELEGTNAAVGENVAYITFVLFERHISPQSAQRTINLIHTFRSYLHYHIKCSKGYIHLRMHAKTTEFLKVINRAKPEFPGYPAVNIAPIGALTSAILNNQINSYSQIIGLENGHNGTENGLDE